MECAGSDRAGAEQRQMEADRLARIEEGKGKIDEAFKGFDDDFYTKRAREYEAFAVPELTNQFDNTQRNLTYSLARSGLLGSGTEAFKGSQLNRELAKQYRGVVDEGRRQSNELRQNVEQQRSNLVSQLQASSDPGGAGALALRTAQSYSQPQSFAPIGNFFGGFVQNYLANANARSYDSSIPQYPWGGATQRVV